MVSFFRKKYNARILGNSQCYNTTSGETWCVLLVWSALQAQNLIFLYEYELYAEPMWNPQREAGHTDKSKEKS